MKFNVRTILLFAILASFSFGSLTSCKARKEAKSLFAESIDELNELLIDETSTPDQLQTKLDAIKQRKSKFTSVKMLKLDLGQFDKLVGLNQKRIDNMKAEIQRKKEEEEKKKKEAEEKKKEIILKTDEQLDLYLQQIATAPTAAEANDIIAKVYDMFSSKTADVLIIISGAGTSSPDYDKPTNIQKYLNYVKDQKLYSKKVYNLEMDDNGKIKLLELLNR